MSHEKFQIVDNIKYSYSADWIYQLETKNHWLLYWEQLQLMHEIVLPGDNLLEIGPGTGFCSNYLRSKGVNVTTLDIDKEKKPDIHLNIVSFKPENSYNHILGFEVFEHIPYDKFIAVLRTLKSFCNNIFISVPVNEVRLFILELSMPVVKKISFSIYRPKKKITESHHFWEVNLGKYKEKKIFNDIRSLGYRISFRKKFQSRLFFVIHNEDFK